MKKIYIDLETNRKLFLTSDLHFGHNNVLKFCNRPFADTKEMEKKLIENWNNVVTNEDYVFILGDVFWFNHGSDMKRVFSKLILEVTSKIFAGLVVSNTNNVG